MGLTQQQCRGRSRPAEQRSRLNSAIHSFTLIIFLPSGLFHCSCFKPEVGVLFQRQHAASELQVAFRKDKPLYALPCNVSHFLGAAPALGFIVLPTLGCFP